LLISLMMLGCSNPEPSAQKAASSCQKSDKSQKQWEVEQKIAYLNAHNDSESFKDIVVDRYGNSYVARGKKLTKYNCRHKKVWQADLLETKKNSYATVNALSLDDKFVYVAFGSYRHVSIIKYDFDGHRFPVGTYTLPEDSNIESMVIDKRGNIIVASAPPGGGGEGLVAKYGPGGKSLWFKKYPDTYFYSVIIDKNGNIFAVGDTTKEKASLIVKFDSRGTLLWRKTYKKIDKKDTVTFFSVDIDDRNNLYISGHTSMYTSYLLKFTPSGQKRWSKTVLITGYGMTSGSVVLCGADGKIYLAGRPKYPKGSYKGREHIYRLAVAVYDAGGKLLTKRVPSREETIHSKDILFSKFGFYQQYQRKDGTFYLVQNGKTIYDNLKYVKILSQEAYGHKVQILDRQNRERIVFIKANEAQAVMLPPGPFCGNGLMTHKANIVDSKEFIKVEAIVSDIEESEKRQYKDADKTHLVTKVAKSKADTLFFQNNKKQITFSENYSKPESTLYYKKGGKYGFLGTLSVVRKKNKIVYTFKKSSDHKKYDILEFKDKGRILLGRGGVLGYDKLTPIKYKTLGNFKESLARFTLPDGRKGYVDLKGKEYLD